jgi:ABC-type glycerol-3-phosphate transport system substrate-binding protein
MNMVRKFRVVIIAICILAVFLFSSYLLKDDVNSAIDNTLIQSNSTVFTGTDTDYKKYLQIYRNNIEESLSNEETTEICLYGADFFDSNMEEIILDNVSVTTAETGSISYKFHVPVSGAYNIEIKYFPTEGKGAPIIRSLLINERLPFDEADGLVFERIWVDDNKDFLMNIDGNQAFPAQIEKPDWIVKKIESNNGYTNEPFIIYLESGENIITLESKQEPMEIEYIKLLPAKELQTYEEYKESLLTKGVQIINENEITNGAVSTQAEDAYQKNIASLIPVNDRTSVKTVPYHYTNIVMNTIGGDNWSAPGDKITWEFEVPEDGLYKLAVRFKQVSNRDFYSIRKLLINGEVPFKEATEIRFNYDSKFQLKYLGNKKEDYYFYLNKGVNYISMSVSLGSLGDLISEVGKSVKNFNELYREIIAITGTDPDPYRDYQLKNLIPDMVDKMQEEYDRLNVVVEAFGKENSQKTSVLSTMMLQLIKLIEKPDRIATELSTFNDNVSALSNWTLNLGLQPLLLDYISVCGEGYKLEKAEGNFLQNLKHSVLAFIGSFTNDYTVTNTKETKIKKNLEVWISTSRDQYNVVQRMVNKQFEDSNIDITLKMVGADTIMPATLTGNGPDVAIQVNSILPNNFAYRNAAYDLTLFEDFEEVKDGFSNSSMEFFEYNGNYFALPDQMSFPMMFYRKDILKELGLEIPNTWSEFLSLIPYLQANNMDIYLESTTSMASLGASTSMSSTKAISSVFLSMLYQKGEELYRENGAISNLDSDTSLQVFKQWTEYYTKHNFNVSIDFLTRFRTGAVPLAIVDFTYFNTLKASAPEIEGVWGISPIPGTLQVDGSIDRSTSSIVGASMIIKDTVEQNDTALEAWEFLKWWTGTEAQVTYAKELEAILGAAARYPVANLEAMTRLSWSEEELAVLKETVSWLRGIPQVPGGYITGRYIENAFLRVIDENLNPVDTLYSMNEYINQELKNKREEFGLTSN